MHLTHQSDFKSITTKDRRDKATNEGVSLPSRTIVHAKLEMTSPQDAEELEADAVANEIVSVGKIRRKISQGGSGSSGIAVSSQMESQLSRLQGGGQQMPSGLLSMMENGFGRDLSQVRLHTDSDAATMSSSIHAKAFTHGNDIYFNQGQFSPNTSEGQKLMAHELTHVVQGKGTVRREVNNEKDDIRDENVKQTANYLRSSFSYLANVAFKPSGNYTTTNGIKQIDCSGYALEAISKLENMSNNDRKKLLIYDEYNAYQFTYDFKIENGKKIVTKINFPNDDAFLTPYLDRFKPTGDDADITGKSEHSATNKVRNFIIKTIKEIRRKYNGNKGCYYFFRFRVADPNDHIKNHDAMLFMINETRNWYVLDNHKIKFLDSDNPEEKVDPQKYRQEALDFIYEQHGNELYNVKYTFDGEEY